MSTETLLLFVLIVLVITQTYSRWVGIGWMVLGMLLYLLFSRKGRTQ